MPITSCLDLLPRKILSGATLTTIVAAFVPLVTSSCSSPTEEPESVLGQIELTVMSEGVTAQPDSLVVLLNGDVSGTMGPNGTFTIPFLPPGQYVVALREEWEQCWFGANERRVTVEPRETTPITYLVRCQ